MNKEVEETPKCKLSVSSHSFILQNTRLLNPLSEYEEGEKVLFACSNGFYITGTTEYVLISVCRNGSLVKEFPDAECLEGKSGDNYHFITFHFFFYFIFEP